MNMSKNIPDFDPYVVLGVDKDTPISDVKIAYRKLILKCHPDKIKDESLRAKANDEFQKVQESYEILSDDSRRRLYDQEIRLAALRKEVKAQKTSTEGYSSFSRGTGGREYRDGRVYEERAPADAGFFSESDEQRFTEEPSSYSRTKRAHTKVSEEKKKSKSVPLSSPYSARQTDRDYVKSGHHDRAKNRTRERRRDAFDKHERTYAYTGSGELSESDTDVEYDYKIRVSTESRSAPREPVSRRKTEPVTSHRYRPRRSESNSESEDGDYEHELESKQNFVKEYIHRSREPIVEVDRRSRPSRTHTSYESHRYERESARYSSRAYTRTEDVRIPATSPPRNSRRSNDRLSSPVLGYERSASNMPTTASPPKVASSRAPIARSSTAPYPRPRREGPSRSESNGMPTLVNMLAGLSTDPINSSKSRPRGVERYDSGYSSGAGTPEMLQGPNSASKVNRFKIVDPPEREPETIIREPADTRYCSSSPPSRLERERSSTSSRTPKPSRTYTYEPDVLVARPAAASRSSSSRLFGEVRYAEDITLEGRRYARRQPAY